MSHPGPRVPASEAAPPRRGRRRTDRTGPSARWTALLLAVPLGALGSGALVWQASYAAFTATTTNPGNSWTAGSVVLSDDDASAAMFTAGNLAPGATGERCITVSYTGTLASAVKLYVAPGGRTGDNGLAQNLDLVVTEGTGGGFGSCSGFVAGTTLFTGDLSGLATSHVAFGSGVGQWAPTGTGQTRTYRFTYTLAADSPDSVQGATAGATFTWEAQST